VRHDVVDVALDRLRRDAMLDIIFELLLAPASVSASARSIDPVIVSA